MQKLKEIVLFEAFSGIGAQFKALKNISATKNWKIVSGGGFEWFIPAIIAYQAIHYDLTNYKNESFDLNISLSNDSKKPVSLLWKQNNLINSKLGYILNQSKQVAHNLFDIININYKDIPKNIDIFTYSFPCQDISNQGKQLGFDKNSSTRSGLLWEIDKILKNIKYDKNKQLPKYLLLENVKAIINKKHIKNFNLWLKELETLGYENKTYILNARNFKSSQNRERVFVLSVLKTHKKQSGFKFKEINGTDELNPLSKILDKNIKFDSSFNKYKLNENHLNNNFVHKYELINYTKFQSENYIFDINYSGPTLTASGALSRIKLFFGNNKIRYMNPLECFKYMGFDEQDYIKVKKTKLISDSKMVFLCGNSISVQVLEAIFDTLEF